MEQAAQELYSFIKAFGLALSLIGGLAGIVLMIVLARVKSFQSVKSVEGLTRSLDEMKIQLQAVLASQVALSTQMASLSAKVGGQSDLVGQLMDQVGRYTEEMQDEIHRVHNRINTIEREGCALGKARHANGGNGADKG